MYIVYVIRNYKGILYKGVTQNLQRRLEYHNKGLSKWTKNKGPWELVYRESFKTKSVALKREIFLKSGKGRSFLREKLSGCSSVG